MDTIGVAKNRLIEMLQENRKKTACISRLGNGSQRRGVKLDPNRAWQFVETLVNSYPDMKKRIQEIAGNNITLVTCETVVCYGNCDQKPHRDHTYGFGRVAGFVIDLDDRPLYTQFFEDQHGERLSAEEPRIAMDSVLVYDTYTLHAGSGARRFPGIKKSKHRLFCEFTDTSSPECPSILLQSGSRMRKRYPPPLGF